MNKLLKITLIAIGAIVLVGTIVYLYLYNILGGLQETTTDKDYKIIFHSTDDTIFIKASSWGLTGDHIQIQVSGFPIASREYDSAKNLIFYEPTIYYEQKRDTLIIYSPSVSNAPTGVNTRIKIVQVEIKGLQEIKKFERDYKNLGLDKVSVYD